MKMNIISKGLPDPTLEEVAARVRDGIALGGSYDEVFMAYAQAHHDRAYLFRVIEEMRVIIRAAGAS
jgi:hypothetical protein